jgi:isopenicillin-N N-acyltransferase like protein
MAIFKMRVLTLEGAPRQRGRQHGEELREEIGRHLDLYRENIQQDTGLDAQAFFHRLYAQTDFLPAIEKYTPDLLEEVRGIAEGAGRSFDEVLARQLSDEDPWFRQIVKFGRTMPENCSCLGTREAGRSLIAQNMDSPAYYDGFQMLVRVHEPQSDVESLVFTVAGKLSLAGMNNYGIGICCNSVLQLDFNPRGLPEDFIVRKVLQQRSLADVLAFMRAIPHASGQNYVLGGPGGVVDLECSARKVVEAPPLPDTQRVYHTNHPLVNDDTSSWDDMWARGEREAPQLVAQMRARQTTFDRFAALKRDVEADLPLDVRRAAEILSDHTAPVCLHHTPAGNYTLGCLIMELDAEAPRLHVAGGTPCSTPFRTYAFD